MESRDVWAVGSGWIVLMVGLHNPTETSIFLGLALIFDPFDHTIAWKERPSYQKGWLILHALCVAGLFGYSLGK